MFFPNWKSHLQNSFYVRLILLMDTVVLFMNGFEKPGKIV